MKPRQAAALALAGWYLIAPPPRTADDVPDPKAPLSYWQIIGRFDTIEDCHEYPARYARAMRGFYPQHPEISEPEKRNDEAAGNFLSWRRRNASRLTIRGLRGIKRHPLPTQEINAQIEPSPGFEGGSR